MWHKHLGLFAGIASALLILSSADFDGNWPAVKMAAIAVLMAVFWVSEAIPLAATALMPLVLFPLLGISSSKTVAAHYMNSTVFLLLGGFMIALAMQRCNLHKRFALKILTLTAGRPVTLMLGFMLTTATLSMWISNTATTLVMLPIALAVIERFQQDFDADQSRRFSVALLLSIAYSASVGGMMTLVGTAPNLVFAQNYLLTTGHSISFLSWMLFAMPVGLLMLLVLAVILMVFFLRKLPHSDRVNQLLQQEAVKMGKMSPAEQSVLVIFTITALLWMTRKGITLGSFSFSGWTAALPFGGMIDDGTVAIAMAVLMFFIPARYASGQKMRLLDERVFVELPWPVILLFGGGFALAFGFVESGLSVYLAGQLTGLKEIPLAGIVLILTAGMTLLTELTSNTATAQLLMPVLSAVAEAIQVQPLALMLPATLAASCAFMFPVATPPNAIVFGSGKVKMADMLKVGGVLNFLAIIIISILSYFLAPLVF